MEYKFLEELLVTKLTTFRNYLIEKIRNLNVATLFGFADANDNERFDIQLFYKKAIIIDMYLWVQLQRNY